MNREASPEIVHADVGGFDRPGLGKSRRLRSVNRAFGPRAPGRREGFRWAAFEECMAESAVDRRWRQAGLAVE